MNCSMLRGNSAFSATSASLIGLPSRAQRPDSDQSIARSSDSPSCAGSATSRPLRPVCTHSRLAGRSLSTGRQPAAMASSRLTEVPSVSGTLTNTALRR